jgi:hypothetical protein
MVVQPAGAFDWVKKSPVKCSGNARWTISEQMTGKPRARRTWAIAPSPAAGSQIRVSEVKRSASSSASTAIGGVE